MEDEAVLERREDNQGKVEAVIKCGQGGMEGRIVTVRCRQDIAIYSVPSELENPWRLEPRLKKRNPLLQAVRTFLETQTKRNTQH
jgi:hypothetical protein